MTAYEVDGVAGHHAAEEPEKFALMQVRGGGRGIYQKLVKKKTWILFLFITGVPPNFEQFRKWALGPNLGPFSARRIK